MYFVISYDISNDRRRNKLARLLEDYGSRVQYSVFDCMLDERKLQHLRHRIDQIIDPDTDSVRFYRMCARCEGAIEIVGRGTVLDDDPLLIV